MHLSASPEKGIENGVDLITCCKTLTIFFFTYRTGKTQTRLFDFWRFLVSLLMCFILITPAWLSNCFWGNALKIGKRQLIRNEVALNFIILEYPCFNDWCLNC